MHHHCRDWCCDLWAKVNRSQSGLTVDRWPEISIFISVHIFIICFLLLLNIKIFISFKSNELYFRQFLFYFIKSKILISPLLGLVLKQFQEDRLVLWLFFYLWHLHKLTSQLPLSYGILISVYTTDA